MNSKMQHRSLDPRAQAAIDHLRVNRPTYYGAICPHNLPAALPIRGERHGWRDAVTVFLLCELISVHRFDEGKAPYWRGALYQVNRRELAKRLACDPDEVSAGLSWLKALGLVFVVPRTLVDGEGKPCGKVVFVAPRMDRVKLMLDCLAENGYALTASELIESDPLQRGLNSPSEGVEVALKDASNPLEQGAYLNCAQTQQNRDAEIGGGTSAKRQTPAVEDDRQSPAVDGGGGEAAADRVTQMPRPPRPSAPSAHGTQPAPSTKSPLNRNGHPSAAPAARWTPPLPPKALSLATDPDKLAWDRAAKFCALWAQAQTRLNYVTCCAPTSADHRAAFRFFQRNPQTSSFYAVSVAINAWLASERKKPDGFDNLYYCRDSLVLGSFLRAFVAGALESEIGCLGWAINTWQDLRSCFTASELALYGWSTVPVLGIPPDELWENDPNAPDYYRCRNLPLPPEILAVQ